MRRNSIILCAICALRILEYSSYRGSKPVPAESCKATFKDSSGSSQRSRVRTRVFTKMKRPFAREIILLKSDSLGHEVPRFQCEATKSNWVRAKVCKSELASLSVARSYGRYDDSVRA